MRFFCGPLYLWDTKYPGRWQDRLWNSVQNATLLVVPVTGELLKNLRDGCRFPPRRYRLAYRDLLCDFYWYAVPPLHWVLRFWNWWRWHRWDLERYFLHRGIMAIDVEGGWLKDAYFVNVPARPEFRKIPSLIAFRLASYRRRKG